jgi:hypothetical protein
VADVLTRTPLRVGSLTAWVEPRSGTVRVGLPDRYRTVFAGLPPSSYLLRAGQRLLLASANSAEALAFSLSDGVPDAVGTLGKPDWCATIEASLPEPLETTPTWLEVALSDSRADWCCSIPAGTLPRVQTGIVRRGLRLRRITSVRMNHDDDH